MSLYREVALTGAIPLFDLKLKYNEKGVLSHVDSTRLGIDRQQGVHLLKLLPWDGLEVLSTRAYVCKYTYGYSESQFPRCYEGDELINWITTILIL